MPRTTVSLVTRPVRVLAGTLAATLTFGCADTPTEFDGAPPALDAVALADHVPESCGAGFWKNHMTTGEWGAAGYAPGQPISEVFAGAAPYANHTLSDALAFGGGNGVNGAKSILLRAAVAAALNAAHPGIEYALSLSDLIDEVEAALAGGQRKAMLALAGELDAFNDGSCVLDDSAPGLPDLIVTDIVFTTGMTRLVTVKNVGTAPVDVNGVTIQGWLSTDENLDFGVDAAAGGRVLAASSLILNPGESVTVPNGGGTPAPDHMYLIEQVDSNHVVTESDETNNTKAVLLPAS
jgi:hypothetical protein